LSSSTLSGEQLRPDYVSVPCPDNTYPPTSFLRLVGRTPLPRHRFCALSGEHLYPDIVSAPCRENTQMPGIASIRCRVFSNFMSFACLCRAGLILPQNYPSLFDS